ncbi:hypothetical protein VP01_11251g1, partial [Puccinia sorghi]
LGKAIELRLDESGSNFPVWRALLATMVGIVFELSKYFDEDATDYQPDRGRLVGILVENSVHANLVPDIQGKQVYRRWQHFSTDKRCTRRNENLLGGNLLPNWRYHGGLVTSNGFAFLLSGKLSRDCQCSGFLSCGRQEVQGHSVQCPGVGGV